MILEILLFLYTLIVVPFHKLKAMWKRYYICEVTAIDDRIVVVIGNHKMNTDYTPCNVGEGMFFGGNYYSNKQEKVETLVIDEDF